MDIRPKRRKFQDNPYTLKSDKENNLFLITFKNNTGYHEIKVNEEIFNVFDESERYENARLKEYSVHIEHSEQNEISLTIKNVAIIESIEESVIKNTTLIELKESLFKLPLVQKNRIIKYYFFNKTLKEIADDESCSINAVKHSIDRALHTLSIKLKNSNFKD